MTLGLRFHVGQVGVRNLVAIVGNGVRIVTGRRLEVQVLRRGAGVQRRGSVPFRLRGVSVRVGLDRGVAVAQGLRIDLTGGVGRNAGKVGSLMMLLKVPAGVPVSGLPPAQPVSGVSGLSSNGDA